MGYLFDAMQRRDDEAPEPRGGGAGSGEPRVPEPLEPAPLDDPRADAARTPTPLEPAWSPADPPERAAGPGAEPETAPALDEPSPLLAVAAADRRDPPAGSAPAAAPEAASGPTPVPAAAPVAADRDGVDDRLVALTDPGSLMAEEYRSIRTSLLARWEHRRHLIHTVTSATPQEGKTITSLNLGLSFAELRNRRTIVVEADLRLPTFAKLLQTGNGPGLVTYLRGESELGEVIQRFEGNLDLITAGGRANDESVQLLSGARAVKLLALLRERYDHVIIDTPPVLELADAGILGALSDEVLLIARMQRTPKPLVETAVRTLKSYHAPVSGIIATDANRHRHRYHYYRYGYRYRYGYGYRYGYTNGSGGQSRDRRAA